MRRVAAMQHTRPDRQDRRVASSEPVAELGGSFHLGERGVCGGASLARTGRSRWSMSGETSILGAARRACGGRRPCSTLAPVGRTAGVRQVSPWWSSGSPSGGVRSVCQW